MGGRGASSGARKTKNGTLLPYGSEYRSVLQNGNIKFVVAVSGNATAPMDTMTKGRIYVTLDYKNEPKFISMYDENGKRTQQIDLSGAPHRIDGELVYPPHVHMGYEHDEKGSRKITPDEGRLIEEVKSIWTQFTESK